MADSTIDPPTNRAVADKLGLSESGVSRLRSGDRLPSLALMGKIQEAYGWSIQAQWQARADAKWTSAFEEVLVGAGRFDD